MDRSRCSAQVAGLRLSWARAGHGRPLLYLHDAGADTLTSPAFDELAVDHDVVLLDLPGYGGSEPPGQLDGPAAMADLLAALLDHLGWVAPLVAGTSLGGWFAVELALRHPERVAGLVLADPAGLHCPEDYLLSLFSQGRAAASAQEVVAQAIWSRLPPEEGVNQHGAIGAAVWSPWVAELAAAASCSWHPHTANPRLLGLLPRIRCPAVVLWGEADALIPLEHGRLFAGAMPAAELEIVAGAGHLVALDAPERLVAAVRRLPVA